MIGGQFLDGADCVIVSGPGVQAKVIEHVKPLTNAQAGQLRDQLKELIEQKSTDAKAIAEIRAKLAGFVRRPTTPALVETVRLLITIAPGVATGERELRLTTSAGLTNPLKFFVD